MFDIRKFAANGSIFRATARFVVLAIEAAAFSALLLGALPRPAAAAVFEIDSGGSLSVYDVPSVTTSEGVKPIIPDRRDIAPQDIRSLLTAAAQRYALDEKLLLAVARQESGFRANAVSPKGAVGPMQLMAGTAQDLGVNRHDPSQNILGGAAYLRQMLDRFHGDQALALAAYNAGPGAVERSGGIPAFRETRRYVSAILGQAGQSLPIPVIHP